MASTATEPTASARNRADINRANAQNSTGPRTAAGKNRVRLNALKHGALSRTVVFPYEDQSTFDALGARLTAAYLPHTQEERDVLSDIQNTHWRLDRVLSLEANLYAVGIREQLEPAKSFFPHLNHEGHIGIARARAYREDARVFEQYHRQEMRLRRLLDRQVAAYADLQSAPAEPASEPEIALSAAAAAESAGFVSHPDPAPSSPPEEMPHFVGSLKEFKRKQWLKQHGK